MRLMGNVTSYKFQVKKTFISMQTVYSVTILEICNLMGLKLDLLFQRKEASQEREAYKVFGQQS